MQWKHILYSIFNPQSKLFALKQVKASNKYFVGIEIGNYYHFHKTEFEITTGSMQYKLEGSHEDIQTTNALEIETHESDIGEYLMSILQLFSGVFLCVAQGSDKTPSKRLGDGYQYS